MPRPGNRKAPDFLIHLRKIAALKVMFQLCASLSYINVVASPYDY
jgi:hypothetical protein